MLTGTLVISHDLNPNAATAKAVVAQLKDLPEQAFPLIICGFDKTTCLALGAYLNDVCYNMYDYLACSAEAVAQTATLPYLMLVGGGEIRQFTGNLARQA